MRGWLEIHRNTSSKVRKKEKLAQYTQYIISVCQGNQGVGPWYRRHESGGTTQVDGAVQAWLRQARQPPGDTGGRWPRLRRQAARRRLGDFGTFNIIL